jgi:hypothetical protein
VNDEEPKEQKNELEVCQTESGLEYGRRKRSKLYVFLCWFAGIQVLALAAIKFGLGGIPALGTALSFWASLGYPFIIPLTLMGIACGLPRYKDRNKIKTMLLLNVALWLAALFFTFLFILHSTVWSP